MRATLPLLFHETSLAWSPQVRCSDASSEGYGACVSRLDPALVATIGRCDERWRFRADDAIDARVHALRPDILNMDVETLSLYPSIRLPSAELPWGEHLLDEVPARTIASLEWKTCLAGKWEPGLQILRTEGKALVMSVRHALRNTCNLGTHLLFLVDNLPLAPSCAKGRASSAHLMPTCRELAALSLFSRSRFHTRWIPSELNPADAPSRGSRQALSVDLHKAADLGRELAARKDARRGPADSPIVEAARRDLWLSLECTALDKACEDQPSTAAPSECTSRLSTVHEILLQPIYIEQSFIFSAQPGPSRTLCRLRRVCVAAVQGR